ncbi:cysteine hydrolase family protein [Roseibium algae]|uniref:Isochorismatase family cysteine hydrolase n=1 Tax=Roseibium algae TaxID=3123038 RepID=A0ABU8TEC2_9HYPH
MSDLTQTTLASSNGARHEDRWTREHEAVSLVRRRSRERPIRFGALPETVEVDLATCAFVVIDMQNDFLHPEGWFAAERGADVSPLKTPIVTINELSRAFRQAEVPVVHLNWGVRPDAANLPANVLDKGSDCGTRAGYADRIGSGPVLVSGEWGALSLEAIQVEPDDIMVNKHRLSGFRDNEFDQILRRFGITTLFFAGVNIDRCVFATLMDGAFQGYDVILVEDACATVSPEYVTEAILYLVRLLYGFTAESTDLLKALTSPK